MRTRFMLVASFALVALGCEDDARDLDYLKPQPILIDAASPDAGSNELPTPDAGGAGKIMAPDAGVGVDAAANDSGSDDAG